MFKSFSSTGKNHAALEIVDHKYVKYWHKFLGGEMKPTEADGNLGHGVGWLQKMLLD